MIAGQAVRTESMNIRKGIVSRTLRRLAVLWLLVSLALALTVGFLYADFNRHLLLSKKQDALEYLRVRIDQLEDNKEKIAQRNKVHFENEHLLDNPSSRQVRLNAHFTSLGGSTAFQIVQIYSADHKLIASYGVDADMPSIPKDSASRWYFDAHNQRLYHLYLQPVWLGADEGMGTACFFSLLDNAVLFHNTFPDVGLRLVWQDKVVASSAGPTALGESSPSLQDYSVSIPWDDHDNASPMLGVNFVEKSPINFSRSLVELLVVAVLSTLLAWFYFGRWLTGIAKRIQAKGEAVTLFAHDTALTPEVEALLDSAAQGNDEVAEVSQAVADLMRKIESQKIDMHNAADLLMIERERAEVTLACIGDAVVTTNEQGKVTFMNPVAEQLSGISIDEARGLLLDTVLHIINESSRMRVINPVHTVLRERRIVELANHSILLSRNGSEYNIQDSAAPIFLPNGELIGCVMVFHDVTEKHQQVLKEHWMAGHDVLTGLPNRALLTDRLKQAVAFSYRNQKLLVVCFLDLDHFKPINDNFGHEMGDQLLIEVSRRIESSLRGEDTVARIGGDEFVLILSSAGDLPEAKRALERIVSQLALPYQINGHTLEITASLGAVAEVGSHDLDSDLLLRQADQAMYQAKQMGRNCLHFFDSATDQIVQSQQKILARLRLALHEREFRLHYQPKVNMRTGDVVGFEALIRWQHPERGLLSPIEFLPQIEHTDLIFGVGEWVIEEALFEIEHWLQAGLELQKVSVNINGRHLMRADFAERLRQALSRHPMVPPSYLEIEILETASLENLELVSQIMTNCKKIGVSFSIDDFGTGYSSLTYLRHLPADTLKLDQTFVRDMLEDPNDAAIIEGSISLAQVFHRSTIAEGVETELHGTALLSLGCDLAQGYGIAKPMPAETVGDWLKHYRANSTWLQWGKAHWRKSDFPLLVAQNDHLRWVRQVIALLDGESLHLTEAELTDHHRCRFGGWYYDIGGLRYGHLAAFKNIEAPHVKVHQLGREIVSLYLGGKAAEARQASEQLLQLKDQIIGLLAVLQTEAETSNRPAEVSEGSVAGSSEATK